MGTAIEWPWARHYLWIEVGTYMKVRKFIITAIIFTHASAMSAGSNCNLQSNGVQRQVAEFTDLIKPANIVGTGEKDANGNCAADDGRMSLSEGKAPLGLGDLEAEQIANSTGYIICPASKGGNPLAISAALVGSNMQIVTATHAFIDYDGKKREPLSECYFRNQGNPVQMVKIDVSAAANRFGTGGARGYDDPNEYAVVRLKEPVAGAIPFKAESDELSNGETIIAVSAHQKSNTREFSPHEPVVQVCKNREKRSVPSAPTQYYTDCDLTPMASGGIIVARNSSGELSMKGIVVSGGNDSMNCQPFSLTTGSYTRAIAVDGNFKQDVTSISSSLPIRPAILKSN